MPVIAITGGLGSGKSTVRKIFEELGAAGIDTDLLAREAVEPGTEGIKKVREAFGQCFFDSSGRMDRVKMADMVFHDRKSLRRLESILHPLIRQAESRIVADHLKREPGRVIVVEIPLLAEVGRASAYDGVVLVTAPDNVRIERLKGSGRYEEDEAIARMKAQVSDGNRKHLADWTVDNSGTKEQTKKQVEKIYLGLRRSKTPQKYV